MRHASARLLAGGALLIAAVPAAAHGFGRSYVLPVPFWLYSYAAVATLLLTFMLAGFSLRAPHAGSEPALPPSRPVPGVLAGLPAVFLLAVALLCGWYGVRNPFANLGMSLFWVGFVLMVPYLGTLLGDLNARCNPFHALLRLLAAGLPLLRHGLLRYPAWLASWPALFLYMAFVHVELFGHQHPHGLASLLAAYAGITVLGGLLFGADAWLRHGESFGVLLRLLGLMAPRCWRDAQGRHWLPPFAGLLRARCEHFSELVFLLFLLTATSFDGLHQSAPWVRLFWSDLLRVIAPAFTPPLISHYEALVDLFGWWQQFWLLAMPFLYGGLYLLCMVAMRPLTATRLSVRELSLHFALTLLPIILVYHLGHYLSLLVTQGTQLIPLASDPLGRGWDLFGTASWVSPPIVLAPATLWHSQVFLIVAGHGVSVWLAHVEALRLFGTPRLAMRSQWPMLLLMLFLTVAGLWILAQPYSPPSSLQTLQSL